MSSNPEQKPGTDAGALTFKQALAKIKDGKKKLWVMHYLQCFNKTEAAIRAGYGDPDNPKRRKRCSEQGWEVSREPAVALAVQLGFREAAGTSDEVLARLTAIMQADIGDFFFPVERQEPLYADVPAQQAIADLLTRAERARILARRLARWNEELAQENIDRANGFEVEAEIMRVDLERNPQHTVKRQVGMQAVTYWELNIEKAREAGLTHLIEEWGYDKAGRPTIKLSSKVKALELLGKHFKLFADRMSLENPDGSAVKFIAGLNEGDL